MNKYIYIKTIDLYKEIKDITGSYTARCGGMNLCSGNTATEEIEVKIRWQQYTEELYRIDPNIIYTFSETRYEDEPHILETEVKDAIKHISNRKSSGCDGIPIELLKAGGDASIKILLILLNIIWRTKEWHIDRKKSVYTRHEIRNNVGTIELLI